MSCLRDVPESCFFLSGSADTIGRHKRLLKRWNKRRLTPSFRRRKANASHVLKSCPEASEQPEGVHYEPSQRSRTLRNRGTESSLAAACRRCSDQAPQRAARRNLDSGLERNHGLERDQAAILRSEPERHPDFRCQRAIRRRPGTSRPGEAQVLQPL